MPLIERRGDEEGLAAPASDATGVGSDLLDAPAEVEEVVLVAVGGGTEVEAAEVAGGEEVIREREKLDGGAVSTK